ncbi:MAG: hypothetical protein NPIRA06_06390 [Nitrospirales bacterium]|nr:MAG: hypothetical protein NPIRA06_06390 [Nitrospirales bacterium]
MVRLARASRILTTAQDGIKIHMDDGEYPHGQHLNNTLAIRSVFSLVESNILWYGTAPYFLRAEGDRDLR